MEITLPKKLTPILAAAGLLALLAALAALLAPRLTGRTLAQAVGFDSGQAAAVSGAQAFYAVDYQEAPQKWSARLCALGTAQGCAFYEALAPALWETFSAEQTVITSEVQAVQQVFEGQAPARQDARLQIWELHVTLSAPWPQSTDGAADFTAYALVLREEGGWKFERLLMQAEVERYLGGDQ